MAQASVTTASSTLPGPYSRAAVAALQRHGVGELSEALLIGGVASLGLMILLGHFVVFVNQSSLSAIYSARLTRAYVGASNPMRWDQQRNVKGRLSPTEPIAGDEVTWERYAPHVHGGPLQDD